MKLLKIMGTCVKAKVFLSLLTFSAVMIPLRALADIIPGRALCTSDTRCELVLRNTESIAYRCTISVEARVTNNTGREAYVWSDRVRDILIESDQETKAKFDFSEDLRAIWATDSSYGNLSPTKALDKECLPVDGPNPDDPSEVNYQNAGLYQITNAGLSCNSTPAPCYDNSCRIVIFKTSRIVNAARGRLNSETGKPWLFDQNFSCWIRGSSQYIKPIQVAANTDITTLGSHNYRVVAPGLSCNKSPAPCNADSCRILIHKNGAIVNVTEIVNQPDMGPVAKPWFLDAEHNCFVRASTQYLQME